MKRVDEYGPTAMERAEAQLEKHYWLTRGPIEWTQYNNMCIETNRTMLAAMREHNENMRRNAKVSS